MKKNYFKSLMFALIICSGLNANAQTQLISASDGGFENATSTFAANGWSTALPAIARQWQVGTAAGSAGAGTKAAYVGAAANYNGANVAQVGHFYRDLVIPAGATSVTLNFSLRMSITDNTFDYIRVFTTTTANTPVSGTNPGAGYTLRFENTLTAYAAFTAMSSIDLTALAGTTVRLVFTNVSDGVAPAANPAVDNITLSYVPAVACSGTPTAGSTSSTSTLVCSSTSFTLSLTGATTNTGITYQWQSSPDNITYTNIAGATAATYTTTQSSSKYYLCRLTCTSSGLSANSAPLQVVMNSLANCYCIPVYATGCANDRITNFILNTLSNNSGATCSSSPAGYSQYGIVPSNLTTTLNQGASYTATISAIAGNANGTGVAIWIDYNDNGVFDVSERNDNGATKFASNTTGTLLVNIPAGASLGNHSMRVMACRNTLSNALDPCTPGNAAGETEDYIVTIGVSSACSGNPNAGTTQSTANPVCPGAPFTLTLSGATTLAGLTYQWQTSPDNITWTNAAGAISSTYVTNQSANTYYRCEVTCSNSSQSAISVSFLVSTNSIMSCYCVGTYSNACTIDYISNVTFGSINNTTTCSGSLPNNQTSYTSPNPTFYRGFTYPISVTTDGDVEGMRAWIDYDHSFTFIAGESVLSAAPGGPPLTTSGTVSIPLTASLGQTVLRVRCRYFTNVGTGAACTNFTADYGETEDYLITIADPPSCSGTPTAGTTSASANPVCSGTTVNFSLSGASVEAGLTYQWQSSPDNITYTNIAGATTSIYSAPISVAVYGRCRLTCTNSGLSSNSTPVHMTLSPFYDCYCAPSYGNGCGIDYISNVTFNGINNTTGCTGSTPSNLTIYNTPDPTFSQGFTYPISITTDGDIEGLGVWIDYNQNGVFDANATEYILSASAGGPPQTTTGNITIPTGVPSGPTKMRVRCRYSGAVANSAACTAFGSGYGETEDYLITIGPQVCIANPTSPSNGASMCPDGFTNLSWPSLSGATGYNVYLSTVNPPTTLVSSNQPGTTYTPPSGLSPGTTYYWSVLPVGPGGTSCSSWSFTIKAVPNTTPSSNAPVCAGASLTLFGDNFGTGQTSASWSWSGPSFSSTAQNPILNNASVAMSGTYTLTITNNLGCTASMTTNITVNPNPVISIASQTGVTCNGDADGTADIDAATGTSPYFFYLDNVPTTDGIYSGLTPGPHNADVTDDNGCIAPTVVVTIAEPTLLTVVAGNDSPVCEGTTFNLSCTPAGGTAGYSYSWSGPNSFTSASQNPSVSSPTTVASGPYSLQVTDAHGCTATNNTTATVNPASTVSAGSSQSICAGTDATMAGSFGGGSSSATWSTSGTGSFNNNTPIAIYTPSAADISAGSVTLTYTTNDPSGPCPSVNSSMTLTINTAATVSAGTNQTICSGATATMAGAFGGGASSAIWSTSGTGSFNNNTPTAIYTPSAGDVSSGSVTLTYTTNDPSGPCDAVNASMTLAISPEATVSAGPDQTTCTSSTITMAGSFGGGASSASWSTSGTGTFSNNSPTAIYTPSAADIAAGSVTLTYTTNDPSGPCPSVNSSMTLTINTAATVSAGTNQTICSGATATMAGAFGGGASSAIWSTSGTGSFNNNTPTAIYTPSAGDVSSGSVTLTYTTNDPSGPCDAVNASMTLAISPEATVSAGPDQTTCTSSTITMAGSFGGGASSASWSTSGTGTFSNNSPTAIYTPSAADIAAGSVTLTYTTNDPSGPCEAASSSMTLTISSATTVSAGPNQTSCTNTTITMSGSFGGGASSATWTTSGTGSFSNNTPTAIYTPSAADINAGNVILTYTTNDPAGPCNAASSSMTLTIITAPTATVSLNGSANKCLGQTATVALTFTGTGPWNYTVSDGTNTVNGSSSISPVNVNVIPAATGTYNYTCTTITDANCLAGGTSSGIATIYVSSAPPSSTAAIPVPAANEACVNTVMLITSNAIVGQNIRYSWNTGTNSSAVLFSTAPGGPFAPGPFQTTASQVYAQFGALTGSNSGYNVCVQGVNGCGSTNNRCVFIRGIVSVPGAISPAAGVVACPNDVKNYSCGISGGASVYSWTLNGSPAPVTSGQGTQNVSVTFPAGFTTGNLCVTASLACLGSSTSAARCMSISNNPSIPAAITGLASVCPGTAGVSYSVPSVSGASGYFWSIPAGATIASGANTPSITVNFPASFAGASSVCVAATSACGTSVTRCKSVVSGVPNQPAGINGATTNICNSTVQYSVVNPPAGITYTWTNPAGTTIQSGQGSATILLNVSNSFNSGFVSVVANSILCAPAVSPARTITIFGKPNLPSVESASPASWCNGGFVNFSVASVTPTPTWNWIVSNGTITAGQTSNNIDVTWGTGTGNVSVTAVNGCGSSVTRTQSWTGLSCREEGMSASGNFSVYPNPAHDKVTVSIYVEDQTQFNVKLRDMSGRVLLSDDHEGTAGLNAYEMDLKSFAKGIYTLEVQSAGDSWKTKVVVE